MTLEYLSIAKLGGTIIIPNDGILAGEMLEQLQTHRMLFYSLTRLSDTTLRAVLISRAVLSFSFGDYAYNMKKGDTVFLEIDNE
jgi:hypothetical protein